MNPETGEPSAFHDEISELLPSSQPLIEGCLSTNTWRADTSSLPSIPPYEGSNGTMKFPNSNGNPFVSRGGRLAQLLSEMRSQLDRLEYDTFWDQGVEKVAVPRTLIDRLDQYIQLTQSYQ